jgi:WD40 repeat protein
MDVATGKVGATIRPNQGPVYHVTFSPDGKSLAVGSGGTVTLWDAATAANTATFATEDCVDWIAFSPDGKSLASSDISETVFLWDLASRNETVLFETSATPPRSRLGRRLYDHFPDAVNACRSSSRLPHSVLFTPDRRIMVFGTGARPYSTVKVWHVGTW